MRFRKWNQFRAWFGRYFWLPCPLCGQMYGAHEWHDIDGKSSSILVEKRSGLSQFKGICPDCTRKGLGDDIN